MNINKALKGLIALQAICMIILAVIISVQMLLPVKAQIPQVAENSVKAGGSSVIAEVGTEQITEQEFLNELERSHGEQVLHTMMVRLAVRLEADAYHLSVTALELKEELARMMKGYEGEADFYETMKDQLGLTKEDVIEDAEYRLLLEKIAIRPVSVTDDEARAYIKAHPELFGPRTVLRLSWIVTETRRLAEQALEELQEGEDFASLARRYSTDVFTADNGGDIGYIESDDPFIDANVLEAAAELEAGDMAGPIPVEDGYAVIRLVERQTTTRYDERKQLETARKQLALEASRPLEQIERDLFAKYNATIHRNP